jgi:acyl-CoA thioester hydrolase
MDTDRNNQVAPILAETSCRFKLPINFPDTVIAGANVSEIHSHGFMMEYGIYSKSMQKITSVGFGRIVMLDYTTHQKVKVEEDLIAIIQSLEGKTIQRL